MAKRKTVVTSLANIKGGAVVERFDHVLRYDVLPNIQDENTDPKAVREISIKIKMLPTEDRKDVMYDIVVDKKLAPMRSVAGFMNIGLNAGELVTREEVEQDESLFATADIG